jgi:hypothetical protein
MLQDVGPADVEGQYDPAGHGEQERRDDPPVALCVVPSEQRLGADDPDKQYEPAGHVWQAVTETWLGI